MTMQEIEKQIATRLVRTITETGYLISVYDGEETTLRHSRDVQEIMAALGTTGEDFLRIYYGDRSRAGWIMLIWGNREDLISDNSDFPDINELIERASSFTVPMRWEIKKIGE